MRLQLPYLFDVATDFCCYNMIAVILFWHYNSSISFPGVSITDVFDTFIDLVISFCLGLHILVSYITGLRGFEL